jgi:hypothetical protein
MKRFLILSLISLTTTLNAAIYTITDEDGYVGLPILKTGDYLSMTGGAIGHLNMEESSTADIFNTGLSGISGFFEGIEAVNLYNQADINIYDGIIKTIDFNSDATATIYGGTINTIYSYQDTFYTEPVPGTNQTVDVWTPHITFVCDVDSVSFVDSVLTGDWLDGSSFSITLIDGSLNPEYTAYDNIEFVPEPATLLLLSIGGFCLRKKRLHT